MKIIHRKRQKLRSGKLFPLEITWVQKQSAVMVHGHFNYTLGCSKTVYNEDDLWESKVNIEKYPNFMYWLTHWELSLIHI